MEETMTVSQIGEKVGLSAKTIRYYEEIGLIKTAKRAGNGYRLYGSVEAEQLSLIKNARELGLPIVEIKKLMLGCTDKNCQHSGEFLKVEIKNYLDLLSTKIRQMTVLKERLLRLKEELSLEQKDCNDRVGYCCNILTQLLPTKGGE